MRSAKVPVTRLWLPQRLHAEIGWALPAEIPKRRAGVKKQRADRVEPQVDHGSAVLPMRPAAPNNPELASCSTLALIPMSFWIMALAFSRDAVVRFQAIRQLHVERRHAGNRAHARDHLLEGRIGEQLTQRDRAVHGISAATSMEQGFERY